MPEWVVQLVGMAGMGVGVYAGIRADLARLHAMVTSARESAAAAHRRLDDVLIKGRGMHG